MFHCPSVSCFLILALVCLNLTAGCSQSGPPPADSADKSPTASSAGGDYNPHDVPITDEQKQQLRAAATPFPKAVGVLQELRKATEEETKNGIPENPYKAHQALDQADLVLQWLPEIARDSAVPKEDWETVTTTANDLRTLFEKVHQNIDNRQEPDFASVAGELDQKIAELAKLAQSPAAEAGEAKP